MYENPNIRPHFLKTSVEDFLTMAIRSTSWKTMNWKYSNIVKTPSLSDLMPRPINFIPAQLRRKSRQQGYRDLNPEIQQSKCCALPFGDSPMIIYCSMQYSVAISPWINVIITVVTICIIRIFVFRSAVFTFISVEYCSTIYTVCHFFSIYPLAYIALACFYAFFFAPLPRYVLPDFPNL